MIRNNILFVILISIMAFSSCKTKEQSRQTLIYTEVMDDAKDANMRIIMNAGPAHNHPSFVIWAEDLEGRYLKTIFLTESFAKGEFGYTMVGDSIWLPVKGSSPQPAALPYWMFKKGPIHEKEYLPSQDHPFVDAYTGATPQDNFRFMTSSNSLPSTFRILVEVNQAWDWNTHWNNAKYPDNPAYQHAAQPSLIYAVTVNREDAKVYMNPIGHGDPRGLSGKLFTDLSGHTTAQKIFESIVIELTR